MAEEFPPLFATRGERLLHRWACQDAEWLLALSIAVQWQARPWWRRIGRKAPSPWPPHEGDDRG